MITPLDLERDYMITGGNIFHGQMYLDQLFDARPLAGLSDYSTPIENYYIDSGWGTWGFKATPVCGFRMAECVATGKQPDLIKSFTLDRFNRFDLVGEKGAASVGH